MHHGIISNLAGLGAAMLLLVQLAWAQQAPPQTVRAAVLRVDVPALPPISRLDAPPEQAQALSAAQPGFSANLRAT